MASDLFHDAARAYYGVGPEVYTLANIATHGNAPAGYALGCESNAPEQYASRPIESPDQLASDLTSHAHHLSTIARDISPEQGWEAFYLPHFLAKSAHNLASSAYRVLGKQAGHDADSMAQYHDTHKQYHDDAIGSFGKQLPDPPPMSISEHRSSVKSQPSTSSGLYTSPGIPQPPKQPKSMPGQKSLFAASQPYALGDARTTGTGTQIPEQGEDDNWPVNPMDATSEHVESERDLLRRSADEEDYGIMDAAKKAALGAGIAMSAMGTPSASTGAPPTSLDIAKEYARPAGRESRLESLKSDANTIRSIGDKYRDPSRPARGDALNRIDFNFAKSQTAQGGTSTGEQRAAFMQTPAGRNWIKSPTEIAKPSLEPARVDKPQSNVGMPPLAHSPVETNYEQMRGIGKSDKPKSATPKIDYSMTGTGTRIDCSKNSLVPGDTAPTPSKKEPTCSKADRDAKFNEMLKTVDPKKAAAKKARLARQEAKATAKK